jgi:hypothetical protein
MHDVIGTAGMVQGWTALWHSALFWIVPAFASSVAVTGLLELLAPTGTVRRPTQPLPSARPAAVVSEASVAITRHTFTEPAASGSIAAHGAD